MLQTLFTNILFISVVVLVIWLVTQLYLHSQGAFFAKSSDKRIKDILKIAKIKKGEKVVDLGSGDGRVLIALAKAGANVTGVEIDPLLVRKSKKLIRKSSYRNKINVKFGNLWKEDVSQYDMIVVYGIDHIMKRLEMKIMKEAKKDARVVSVYFKFPNLKPVRKVGDITLYKRG